MCTSDPITPTLVVAKRGSFVGRESTDVTQEHLERSFIPSVGQEFVHAGNRLGIADFVFTNRYPRFVQDEPTEGVEHERNL